MTLEITEVYPQQSPVQAIFEAEISETTDGGVTIKARSGRRIIAGGQEIQPGASREFSAADLPLVLVGAYNTVFQIRRVSGE